MRMFHRSACALALATALIAGCSSDDDNTVTPPPPPPTPDYATVVYRLDDSANRNYTDADGLALAGDFVWDAATGVITLDESSSGPYPALHDDGPVSAGGGEAEGETAGDHVWTVAVKLETPTADATFTYVPTFHSVDGSFGQALDPNWAHDLTVSAGETGTVTVDGPNFIPLMADCVQMTFVIDDSANQSYTAADGLAWKGSFHYDAASRVMTKDGSWGGPFVPLYDDGPWAQGGHEGDDQTAGDHKWSAMVWIDNTTTQSYEYGAIRGSVNGSDGEWIWSGANGTFTVGAGGTGSYLVQGLTIPAWGTVDMRLLIDLSDNAANLDPAWQGVDYTGSAALKGDFLGWNTVSLVAMTEVGAGMYGVDLSDVVGPHDGLLHAGQAIAFVLVLNGYDYRVGGVASATGVQVQFFIGGAWQGGVDPVAQPDGDRNLTMTVPD